MSSAGANGSAIPQSSNVVTALRRLPSSRFSFPVRLDYLLVRLVHYST